MKRLIASLALLALTGCGGKSPTSPSVQPYHQTVSGSVDVDGITFHPVGPLPRSGSMTVTLTWSGGSDLDLYLTNADCSAANVDACTVYASSTSTVSGRESVTRQVNQGDTYRAFVLNYDVSRSVSYQLTLDIQ